MGSVALTTPVPAVVESAVVEAPAVVVSPETASDPVVDPVVGDWSRESTWKAPVCPPGCGSWRGVVTVDPVDPVESVDDVEAAPPDVEVGVPADGASLTVDGSAVPGRWRRGLDEVLASAEAASPPLCRPAGPVEESGPVLSVADPDVDESTWPGAAPLCRAGCDVPPADDVPEPADDDEELGPVDPSEPVVSANAIGIDATAKPTPSATANAPTRPT